jgi:hypothetical protein
MCEILARLNDELSKKQAKQFSKSIELLANGQMPWTIAIIIDATLQKRSRLHAQNVKIGSLH